MADRAHPAERLAPTATVEEARERAKRCRACELWRHATQTVFGAGAERSTIVLVGEQPGDQEDRAGEPFVGPAGRVLEEALAAAGIDRSRVYVTNAVKHFKWVPRGKRRIHARPRVSEILACAPWLTFELSHIRPRVVVCLGTTAARAVLGRTITLSKFRGQALQTPHAPAVFVTAHPSSILRAPDPESRAEGRQQLIADLTLAAQAARGRARRPR
jgi:DNA polymerase